jgi:hypothetical protein
VISGHGETGLRQEDALSSLLALLSPHVPPHFDSKSLEKPTRLEDGQYDTDESRCEDPDEGDDDPGCEEAAREDVVGEEHWDWDLRESNVSLFPSLGIKRLGAYVVW